MSRKIKTSPTKTEKKGSDEPRFTLEVKVNDVEFKTESASFAEALERFVDSPEFPFGAKTKAIFTFGAGKKKKIRIFPPIAARRLLLTMKHKGTSLGMLASKMTQELV